MIRTCECVKGLKRDSSRNEGRNWWKIRGGRGVSEWRVTWRSAGHRAAGIEATSHRDTRIRSERGWSNYEDWPVTDQSDPTGDPGTSSACLSFFRASFRKSCSFLALLIEAQYSLPLFLSFSRARAPTCRSIVSRLGTTSSAAKTELKLRTGRNSMNRSRLPSSSPLFPLF